MGFNKDTVYETSDRARFWRQPNRPVSSEMSVIYSIDLGFVMSDDTKPYTHLCHRMCHLQ